MVSLLFKQRQKDTKETLEDLKELINEINTAKKEQADKEMSSDAFSAYWILKNEGIDGSENIAKDAEKILENYPHWRINEEQERKIKQELHKIFGKSGVKVKKAVELITKLTKILKEAEK